MADFDYINKNSGVAKTLAIVALLIAVAALALAFKADRRASEAIKRSREAYNTNVEVPLDNDDAGDESMPSTDSGGQLEN